MFRLQGISIWKEVIATKLHKQMRRDCRKYMGGAILMSFFHRLTSVAAPMAAAWLIGDMANHLLTLNGDAIQAGLPGFVCAVFFQVGGVAVFNLSLNLLLTKQGFAYDAFLMEKFIHLPLETIQTTSSGAVMERLEEDSAAFCWNQMVLCAYPGAIAICAGVFVHIILRERFPMLFVMTILFFAALPVFRAKLVGQTRAELTRQISEYQGDRKQLEQELYDASSFSRCFGLDRFFVGRLGKRFQTYLNRCGRMLYQLDAKSELLDYLCSHGVQIGTILVGALQIAVEKLTLGSLLSGYLMIPAIRECCGYIKEWVTERHNEEKLLERLSFFYADTMEESDNTEPLHELSAENVSFSYPDSGKTVLQNRSFRMTDQENIRLVGANGTGKTTLMKLMAGLYRPTSGTVCKGASLCQIRNSVAYQAQEEAIFSGTVWENLFLPKEKREQANDLLQDMGFEKDLHYEITPEGTNLSPGEQKKLLLTRALLLETPFLFLDEPLNHLDEQGKRILLEIIRNRQGILIISHQELPEVLIRNVF